MADPALSPIAAWLCKIGVSAECEDKFKRNGYLTLQDIAERVTSFEQLRACEISENGQICTILNNLPTLRNDLGVMLHRPPAYDGLEGRGTSVISLDIVLPETNQWCDPPLYEVDLSGGAAEKTPFRPHADGGGPSIAVPEQPRRPTVYEHQKGAKFSGLRFILPALAVAVGILLIVSIQETYATATLVGASPLPYQASYRNGTVSMNVTQYGKLSVSIVDSCLEQPYSLTTASGTSYFVNYTCTNTNDFFVSSKVGAAYGFTIVAVIFVSAMAATCLFTILRVPGQRLHLPHVGLNLAFAIGSFIFTAIAYALMTSVIYNNVINSTSPIQGLGWYTELYIVNGQYDAATFTFAASVVGAVVWIALMCMYVIMSRVPHTPDSDEAITIIHLTPVSRQKAANRAALQTQEATSV